jgi:predicted ABC-type ATPase
VAKSARIPSIYVLAGTNGAGKSSVSGATFRKRGVQYFNPDDAALRIFSANPGISQAEANSIAWHEGRHLLEHAIQHRIDFTFETTLGGNTITSLLERALAGKIDVRIWYVGLRDVELHIARVQARVARGGHDIPEETIRKRFTQSRLNLIRLLPRLTELLLYDNSEDADPAMGIAPRPRLILHVIRGKIARPYVLADVPQWAKPIVAAAIKLSRLR